MPVFSKLFALTATALISWKAEAVREVLDHNSLLLDTLDAKGRWNIYDKSGPKLKDIAQGELGDCYFLAGLAAIVHRHPDIIEKAFVKKGIVNGLGRSVFLLSFLLDGEEKQVAIDDMVPMSVSLFHKAKPFFARFHEGDNAWPALLEKGFAKLYGSYFSIRAGFGFETFKAITQAPVDVLSKADADTVWNFLVEAEQNSWPVTGGTRENDFGTVASHAFAILETGMKKNQKAVHVYNPWATQNEYSGELKSESKRSEGNYWMLLSEFARTFSIVSRARIIKNAHVSSVRVRTGAGVVKFKTSLGKPFHVQLEWPSKKVWQHEGCTITFKEATLSLKVGASGTATAVQAKKPVESSGVTNLRASMNGGTGEYIALVGSYFDVMTAFRDVVVNVYSEEKVSFEVSYEEEDIFSAAHSLYGLCDLVQWKKQKLLKRSTTPFRGSPAWEGVEGPEVLYLSEKGPWLAPSKEEAFFKFSGFDAADITCVDESLFRAFDKCTAVDYQKPDWKYPLTLKRIEDYAGTTQWQTPPESQGQRKLKFSLGDWLLVDPKGEPGYYFQKGIQNLKCSEASLIEEQEQAQEKEEVAARTGAAAAAAQMEELYLDQRSEDEVVEIQERDDEVLLRAEATVVNSTSQKACDQDVILKKLGRQQVLDNFQDLVRYREEDPLFPPDMSSLGDKDKDCGDSATGKVSNCAELNHWESITLKFGTPDYVPAPF